VNKYIFKDGDLPSRLTKALANLLLHSPLATIDVMPWWKR